MFVRSLQGNVTASYPMLSSLGGREGAGSYAPFLELPLFSSLVSTFQSTPTEHCYVPSIQQTWEMWEMETFHEMEAEAQGRRGRGGIQLCGSCLSLLDVKYVQGLGGTEPQSLSFRLRRA